MRVACEHFGLPANWNVARDEEEDDGLVHFPANALHDELPSRPKSLDGRPELQHRIDAWHAHYWRDHEVTEQELGEIMQWCTRTWFDEVFYELAFVGGEIRFVNLGQWPTSRA